MTPGEEAASRASQETQARLLSIAAKVPSDLHRVGTGPVAGRLLDGIDRHTPVCDHLVRSGPRPCFLIGWLEPRLTCLECPPVPPPLCCLGCSTTGPLSTVLAGHGPITLLMYLCDPCVSLEISE